MQLKKSQLFGIETLFVFNVLYSDLISFGYKRLNFVIEMKLLIKYPCNDKFVPKMNKRRKHFRMLLSVRLWTGSVRH